MATYGRTMRRGLPRRSGGEPWPPADAVPVNPHGEAVREPTPGSVALSSDGGHTTTAPRSFSTKTAPPLPGATTASPSVGTSTATPPEEATVVSPPQVATPARTADRSIRRGLPRVAGGEPWPPADTLPAAAFAPAGPEPGQAEKAPVPAAKSDEISENPTVRASTEEPASRPETVSPAPAAVATAGSGLLRRGLPRVPGGEPWPPETAIAVEPAVPGKVETSGAREAAGSPTAQQTVEAAATPADPAPAPAQPKPPAQPTPPPQPTPPAHPTPPRSQPTPPAEVPPSTATATPAPAPSGASRAPLPQRPAGREETRPRKPRSRTATLLLGALGLLVVALTAVFFTRWLVTLSFMQDFLATYPGETALPAGTDPGFPAWAQWQHFFNFFLIVLIIRSGLQVRREQRPPGYWTPKWSKGSDGKISLTLWFHQTLDVLWLLNGLVFVVLLFITGHWARLVPTTWEVIPNALSALIQYVSLDWPTENGWVNYNSLQMLAYFVTVFIAAPLAAISGARMSGIWPKDAKGLNRIYPVEWARAVHFPVMLYFVVFIIGHVALVFATGALRNLNHMYGGQDAVNWTGFWIFFGSLLLVVGAWFAARPVVLAPIAGLLGRVSSR